MINLIISGDDFGYSPVFNETILNFLENGILSSTNVLVNRIADDQLKQVKRLRNLFEMKNFSVGLHLEVFYPDIRLAEDQYRLFQKIFGFLPTHVDLHKPEFFVGSLNFVSQVAKSYGIPCRNVGQDIIEVPSTDEKVFDGTIDLNKVGQFSDIEDWLKTLEEKKYYEILFHPGSYDPNCRSSLNIAREIDAKNVVKLNKIFSQYNIKLASYRDLAMKFSVV